MMFVDPTVLICTSVEQLKNNNFISTQYQVEIKIGSQIDAMLDKTNGNSHLKPL